MEAPVDNPTRKWEPLDREWVSKSNVMQQGAWVQEGGGEYASRTGFSPHPVSHNQGCGGSGLLIRQNTRLRHVYKPVIQRFIEYE